MDLSLNNTELSVYVRKQLDTFLPDGIKSADVKICINPAMERVERCFSAVHNKYFKSGDEVCFNHLNGDQYSMFLYLLSNTIYKKTGNVKVCEKVFLLNKLLNGIDVFYEVELPEIFLFCHPLGSVLGRAKYDDYLLVNQNCTIGSNHDIHYPVLGKYVAVYDGSSVLGKCAIGDNCKISAHSLILDQDLDDNSIYIGFPHDHMIKPCKHPDRIWEPKVGYK